MKNKKVLILVLIFSVLIISCGSTKTQSDNNQNEISKQDKIIEKMIKSAYFRDNEYEVLSYGIYSVEGLFNKIIAQDIINYFNKSSLYTLKKITYYGSKPMTFVFYKKDNLVANTKDCQAAIRYSIRGMPAPTIYFDDVYTAISKCEKCCKEELESSYYQKVTNGIMKRDIYLKFFPNGKYSDKVKKELIAIKNGANIKDGEIDPLGDLQKTVDIAGKVYDNSVVGQTINEIGKSLPKTNTENTLNLQSNSTYEVLSKNNLKEINFEPKNHTSFYENAPNVFSDAPSNVILKIYDKNGNLYEETTNLKKYFGEIKEYNFPLKIQISYFQDNKSRSANLILYRNGIITLKAE